MGGLLIPIEIAAALAALALLVFLALLIRRLVIGRRPGSFDLSVRPVDGVWSIGVGRFGSTRLDYYSFFSPTLGPSRTFERTRLRIIGPRSPSGSAMATLVVVRCRYDAEEIDLAMSESAYFGLASWAEAAPPGHRHHGH